MPTEVVAVNQPTGLGVNSSETRTGVPLRDRPTGRVEISVRELIAEGRQQPLSGRGLWLLSLVGGLLLGASYFPLDQGYLGFLAPVPFILLVRLPRDTRRLWWPAYFGGLCFTLPTLSWMTVADPMMSVAWIALALYVSLYFPAFVALTRTIVHRLPVPLLLAAPVCWTALEFARAHLLTGFPWYFLGHTQYRWSTLTQIADVTGAYGVSFMVCLLAAAIACVIPHTGLRRCGLATVDPAADVTRCPPWMTVGVTWGVLALVLGYGTLRLQGEPFKAGPRVALVQGNFPSSLRSPGAPGDEIFFVHEFLTGEAMRHQPDLIVWPESMFRWPLLTRSLELTDEEVAAAVPYLPPDLWRDGAVERTLSELADRAGADLLLGVDTFDASAAGVRHQNSSVLVSPQKGITARYGKRHLVPFGEYVPLANEVPLLKSFTPIAADGSMLTAGAAPVAMQVDQWTMSPVICFEDTVPHVVRRAASAGPQGSAVDMIVNQSNDGWFHGSSEHDQHLVTAAFRAIENRMPVLRASNLGISAIINGDGVIVEPEVFVDGDHDTTDPARRTSMRDADSGRWHRALNCVLVHPVPLDVRDSLYRRYGDLFAMTCLGLTVLGWGGGMLKSVSRAR